MKILVVSNRSVRESASEAADITCYEVIETLLELGHEVKFCQLNYSDLIDNKKVLENNCEVMGSYHVQRPNLKLNTLKMRSPFHLKKNDIFSQNLNIYDPDVILSVWSEVAQRYLATHHATRRLIALTGNLDQNIFAANKTSQSKKLLRGAFTLTTIEKIKAKVLNWFQIRELCKFEKIFNPALNDVKYLESRGIKDVSYLPMVWKSGAEDKVVSDNKVTKKHIDVLLSVGKLNNTSNNLVFKTFLKEISENQFLFSTEFKFHIVGGGQFRSAELEKQLLSHSVTVHGFVEDLDVFMKGMDVALILNCYTKFRVSHTRFLNCWAQGLPIVCLPETKESMPEIDDDFNCLFGNNGKELLNKCVLVRSDKHLHKRLSLGGFQTIELFFNTNILKRILNVSL